MLALEHPHKAPPDKHVPPLADCDDAGSEDTKNEMEITGDNGVGFLHIPAFNPFEDIVRLVADRLDGLALRATSLSPDSSERHPFPPPAHPLSTPMRQLDCAASAICYDDEARYPTYDSNHPTAFSQAANITTLFPSATGMRSSAELTDA
ncbi:hypothetical protein CCHR01_05505 [Colletotrichum chrysophilum]|uniref:Uncharacterized protein n=1 Tax=Colletotrichum chrysophilum TaxID=1836956 RepID=A0AAD9EKJ5_9PEZI|nr:hypothetical protein CCHR01_05505 [Colletotrichum chrysophilum]